MLWRNELKIKVSPLLFHSETEVTELLGKQYLVVSHAAELLSDCDAESIILHVIYDRRLSHKRNIRVHHVPFLFISFCPSATPLKMGKYYSLRRPTQPIQAIEDSSHTTFHTLLFWKRYCRAFVSKYFSKDDVVCMFRMRFEIIWILRISSHYW